MRSGGSVLVVLALAGLLAGSVAADVVVPNVNAAAEGNINNNFPFNLGAVPHPSGRYQQVYGASAFAGPILISGIAFRPDATFSIPGGVPVPGSGGPFGPTTFPLLVTLSTTASPVDGLAQLFAANVGPDVTTVFSGPVTLSSSFTGPAGGPKDFDIVINFTTPFLYDPAGGNLLLDVTNPTSTNTTVFDAQFIAGDTVSRVFAFSSSSPVSEFPDIDSFGLVTKFIGTPIPEPSAAILLLAAVVASGCARRRRGTS